MIVVGGFRFGVEGAGSRNQACLLTRAAAAFTSLVTTNIALIRADVSKDLEAHADAGTHLIREDLNPLLINDYAIEAQPTTWFLAHAAAAAAAATCGISHQSLHSLASFVIHSDDINPQIDTVEDLQFDTAFTATTARDRFRSCVRSGTVRTSILVLSDTHLANPFPSAGPASASNLPHIDLLIHAGDLTMFGTPGEFDRALDMLAEIPAGVKVVIPGNHDLSLDKLWTERGKERTREWLGRNGGNVKVAGELGLEAWRRSEEMWFGDEGRARKEGVRMLREGRSVLELKNGAKAEGVSSAWEEVVAWKWAEAGCNCKADIYATPFTPEFYDWGFAYEKFDDRFNPPGEQLLDATNIAVNPVYTGPHETDTIDIMITHGPPYGLLDMSARGNIKVGCPHLLNALQHCRPRLHCFGHIHEGWGAALVDWSKAPTSSSAEPMTTHDFCRSWDNLSASSDFVQHVSVKPADAIATIGQDHIPRSGRDSLVVNAAIMDVEYRPVNRPWLIYLDLASA
ncbi:hypothetical protein K461DRAFT_267200 [Myriangium duriaei CBS 260.36]|uniref:Calcineurin-like phosphoesterase domain-containing protein n=1 Tax=Myriangium duriaei CBS 260.36 TaxID=1168546 RepID=A0A9P4J883_9PEZI|nr:hypothetical protein K461DRAFT_267200 [Myriangium duriaei CBS 260.36]